MDQTMPERGNSFTEAIQQNSVRERNFQTLLNRFHGGADSVVAAEEHDNSGKESSKDAMRDRPEPINRLLRTIPSLLTQSPTAEPILS